MAAGLVISRNVGQVVIGSGANRVRVEVVEPRNGRVRLRFEAGTNVVINREEIDQQIQGEKMAEQRLQVPPPCKPAPANVLINDFTQRVVE